MASELLSVTRFIVVDNKNRSLEFKLPIKKNSKSIQVLAIKRFLGIPFTKGDLFDEKTKRNLKKWQLTGKNKMAIMDLAGWLDDVDIAGISLRIGQETPEWKSELGVITAPTFVAMLRAGDTTERGFRISPGPGFQDLKAAVTNTLDELDSIRDSLKGSDENPLDVLSERDPLDVPQKPWKDTRYYYYIFRSNTTRAALNRSQGQGAYNTFLQENSAIALQKGVEAIFSFYNKKTTWQVTGKKGAAPGAGINTDQTIFNRVLKYQNLVGEEGLGERQRYTLTIKPKTVADQLGFVGASNATNPPEVNVLFGQSLEEAAEPVFAAIKEVHSPKKRPNSTFKFTIIINRDMFDAIPGGKTISISDAIDAGQQAIAQAEEIYEKGKEIYEAAEQALEDVEWALENPKAALSKAGKAAKKLAKKALRNAELGSQIGSPLTGPQLNAAQEEAMSAALAANAVASETMPTFREYDVSMFEKKIETVAEHMEDVSKDLKKWNSDGGSLVPPTDMAIEAKNLRAVASAMRIYMAANGRVLSPFGFGGDKIKIGFDKVERDKKISENNSIKVYAGTKPFFLAYQEKGGTPQLMDRGAIMLSNSAPWNNPRTMNYLYELEDMYKQAKKGKNWCAEVVGGPGGSALTFATQYTSPTPTVLAVQRNAAININIQLNGSIKNAIQKLEDNMKLLGKDPIGALWKDGVYKIERGRTYQLFPPVPEEDLCTLEQLFQEFLDKFDFPQLFCSYAACIPDIPWPPSFNWDFKFKIPDLPKLPSFDPLAIVIPILEANIIDLIIAFLCALVRAIIDLIRFPNCDDLIKFGELLWEDMMRDKGGEDITIIEHRRARARTMHAAAEALKDMEIPVESFSDIADLFDDISLTLTPSELCSLLQGRAAAETLMLVKEVLKKHQSTLREQLNNEQEIEYFFLTLGKFIDPEVCNRVSRMSNVVLGDAFCPDGDFVPLRQQLMQQDATPEEIAKALEKANNRRKALKSLMDEDPMKNMMPRPGCPDQGGLPGPYDNENHDKMAELAAKGVFQMVEMSFKNDLSAYVPSFFRPEVRAIGEQDQEYDLVAHLEYLYVNGQIENAKLQDEQFGGRDGQDVYQNALWGHNTIMPAGHHEFQGEGVRRIFRNGEERPVPVDIGRQLPRLVKPRIVDLNGIGNVEQYIEEEIVKCTTRRLGYPIVKLNYMATYAIESRERLPHENVDNEESTARWWNGAVNNDKRGQWPAYFNPENTSDMDLFRRIMSYSQSRQGNEILPGIRQHLNSTANYSAIKINEDTWREDSDHYFRIMLADRTLGRSDEGRNSSPVRYHEYPHASRRDSLRDCYSIQFFDRSWYFDTPENNRDGLPSSPIFFSEPIPEEYQRLRSDDRDIEAPGVRTVLLRPGGFAELFLGSWQSLSGVGFNPTLVESHANAIWRKLQGFVLPEEYPHNGEAGATNARIAHRNAGRPSEQSTISDAFAPLGDPGQGTQALRHRGAYAWMADKFMDKIAGLTSASRFFDTERAMQLQERLIEEFIKTSGAEACWQKNNPLLNFEKIKKETIEKYKESLCSPENAPADRKFDTPGPLETGISEQLVILYIKTFILEYILSGVFIFSNIGASGIFQNDFVIQYLREYIKATLDRDFSVINEQREGFMASIKKLANDNEINSAIEEIIKSLTNDIDSDIAQISEDAFQPRFRSFKEAYLNELIDEATSGFNYQVNLDPPEPDERADANFYDNWHGVHLHNVSTGLRQVLPAAALYLPGVGGRVPIYDRLNPRDPQNANPSTQPGAASSLFFGVPYKGGANDLVSNLAKHDFNQGKFYLETYFKIKPNVWDDPDVATFLNIHLDFVQAHPGSGINTNDDDRLFRNTPSIESYLGEFSGDDLFHLFSNLRLQSYISDRRLDSQPPRDWSLFAEVKFPIFGEFGVCNDDNGVVIGEPNEINQCEEGNWFPGRAPPELEPTIILRRNYTRGAARLLNLLSQPGNLLVGIRLVFAPGQMDSNFSSFDVEQIDTTAVFPSNNDETIYAQDLMPSYEYAEGFDNERERRKDMMRHVEVQDNIHLDPYFWDAITHGSSWSSWSTRRHNIALRHKAYIGTPASNLLYLRGAPKDNRPVYRSGQVNGQTGVLYEDVVQDLEGVDMSPARSLSHILPFGTYGVGFTRFRVPDRNGPVNNYEPGTIHNHPSGPRGVDASSWTSERIAPLKSVYPTPVAKYEIPIECLENFVNITGFLQQGGDPAFIGAVDTAARRNYFSTRSDVPSSNWHYGGWLPENFPSINVEGSPAGFQAARLEVSERIIGSYKSQLINGFLGLHPDRTNGIRPLVNWEGANSEVRYLFDFLFPLDRYAAIFAMFNTALMDNVAELRDFFGPTRGVIRRMFASINNPSEDPNEMDPAVMYSVLKGSMTDQGPNFELPSFSDIIAMIKKMIIMAVPTLIRGQAIILDPAYAQLKQLYDEDPCKFPEGMTWGSIANPTKNQSVFNTDGGLANSLEDGLSQNGECPKFSPVTTHAPIDMALSGARILAGLAQVFTSPMEGGIKIATGTQNLVTSAQHAKNAIAGGVPAYGKPMGPIGPLGLSMPELPGEAAAKMRKDAGCQGSGCDEGNPQPVPNEMCEERADRNFEQEGRDQDEARIQESIDNSEE